MKATDSKVHDGAIASDAVASGGSSSDEGKTTQKTDRSRSRKRGSLFGTLLGKKEEHDEKKESKKEEKAEERAIKQEIKNEEKLEKEEAQTEKKLEKEEAKEGIAGGAAPLDAVAVGMFALDCLPNQMAADKLKHPVFWPSRSSQEKRPSLVPPRRHLDR